MILLLKFIYKLLIYLIDFQVCIGGMKNFFIISFASFCFGFARGPGSHGPNSEKPCLDGNDTLARTLLWRISGKDLRGSSYLFGTMHVLCAEDARLSDGLKMAIQQTDEIYFEINLDDIMGMVQSLKYMRMTGSKKLSDYLDSSQYEKVKSYFDKQGSILPFSMLERFKPLLIGSLIEEDGLDCKTTNGMELVIQKQAHLQSKKFSGWKLLNSRQAYLTVSPMRSRQRILSIISTALTFTRRPPMNW